MFFVFVTAAAKPHNIKPMFAGVPIVMVTVGLALNSASRAVLGTNKFSVTHRCMHSFAGA